VGGEHLRQALVHLGRLVCAAAEEEVRVYAGRRVLARAATQTEQRVADVSRVPSRLLALEEEARRRGQ
jgi:hypothetical protein